MKKILSLLAVMLFAVSLSACQKDVKPHGTLVVGTPKLTGDWISGFGNSSYDNSVRTMLWDLATYSTTPGGEFILNKTVVKKETTAPDEAGNKTYTFELQKNMKWSDGEAVTAKDYVFGMLFAASDAWKKAGATDSSGDTLIGYEAYHKGTEASFAGIKLIDDYTFSVTIDAEELPYFYEVAYATVAPSPMHVWAPDVTIGEDGSSLVGDVAAAATEVSTTERFAPTVVSGPFKFVSFEDDAVTLEVNEHYPGDYRGEKSKLEKVIVKYINQTLDVDMVISGDVDLVAGVVEGAKIEKAKESDSAGTVSYKRNGYGMIAFANAFGPTKLIEVRKAIAYLVDRNVFLQQILGGYGALVDGEYGLSQWMYATQKDAVEEKLEHYVFNVEKANELLDQTPYKYEADGKTPFDADKAKEGYWRYDENGVKLTIRHLGTIENEITDLISTELPKGMNRAGIEFKVDWLDFDALLANYYYGYEKGDKQVYHSFNLANGFTEVYDPYYGSYHSDFLGTWINSSQTSDAELDALIVKMRELDPSQKAEYAAAWLDYQVRWNEILPVLPIYSNEYFDIYNARVKGLATTPTYQWARAILDVTVSD